MTITVAKKHWTGTYTLMVAVFARWKRFEEGRFQEYADRWWQHFDKWRQSEACSGQAREDQSAEAASSDVAERLIYTRTYSPNGMNGDFAKGAAYRPWDCHPEHKLVLLGRIYTLLCYNMVTWNGSTCTNKCTVVCIARVVHYLLSAHAKDYHWAGDAITYEPLRTQESVELVVNKVLFFA